MGPSFPRTEFSWTKISGLSILGPKFPYPQKNVVRGLPTFLSEMEKFPIYTILTPRLDCRLRLQIDDSDAHFVPPFCRRRRL